VFIIQVLAPNQRKEGEKNTGDKSIDANRWEPIENVRIESSQNETLTLMHGLGEAYE
jgi:hypothetical protein